MNGNVTGCDPGLTAPDYTPHGLSRRALQTVLAYVTKNIGEPITLGDLAEATGLSRFHFCRLFRISFAESPMRYLQRCRLQYAGRLLASNSLTVAEIALMAGFCDQSHFTRSFRKFAGMTPLEFAHYGGRQGGDGPKTRTQTGTQLEETPAHVDASVS